MPTYTPRYGFPIYDLNADAPDGPAQMRAIVEKVEQVLYEQMQALAAPMVAYTPAINFTIGENKGSYKRVGGSNLIHAEFEQTIRPGLFPASNTTPLTFGLPVPAAVYDDLVGEGYLLKAGTMYPLKYLGVGGGSVGAYTYTTPTSGNTVLGNRVTGNTFGGSWANGDRFYCSITYRAAS